MAALTSPPLQLTSHPIQRTGAWAVAVLANRPHPTQVTSDDLTRVRDRIVIDLADMHSEAEIGEPAHVIFELS